MPNNRRHTYTRPAAGLAPVRRDVGSSKMKTLILLAGIIALLVAPDRCAAAPYQPDDEIRTNGQWKLVTVVLHKGTRSQKVIGKIEYDGKDVIGEKGHCLKTPFGKYVWRGEYETGYRTGWLTADSDMDVAEMIPAEIQAKPIGNQLFTKPSSQQAAGAYFEPEAGPKSAQP